MHNARIRLMAGLAGATLCLFAVTSYGQNPEPTTPTGSAQTQAPTTPTATDQTTPAPTDVTTTTTTTTFPGGMLGILAVAAVVLLLLFGLFRGRDRTVIKETYAAPPAAPGTRNVTTGTAADDRMNLNSRAASGPGTTPGGTNDPNARR